MAKFKPGTSGNPAGRKPGSTPAAQYRKSILDNMPSILESMINEAIAGDVAAAKVLIDKIIPGLKNQSATIQIEPGTTLVESGSNILDEAMSGAIAPDVTALLLSALTNQARLVEQGELIGRIELLENKQ